MAVNKPSAISFQLSAKEFDDSRQLTASLTKQLAFRIQLSALADG
jgi:hypothetical protein